MKTFNKEIRTRNDLLEFVAWAKEAARLYGWLDEVLHPYEHCPVKIRKILADCMDYDRCTQGSREYLILLANGTRRILDKWVQVENEPHVTIRMNGKVIRVLPEILDFIDADKYEII